MPVMSTLADLLMLKGQEQWCPDCDSAQIFVPADEERPDSGEMACTACGAALLIDPGVTQSALTAPSRVA